ncbi:hypothetical protein AAKU52_000007 [Pedobacter sp. CG_S7]|uniref:hypothetical protein n=1 Tax=Pedobacter sp. CG_S7 TaxID=3143930 RepID=UPI003397BED2
MQGRKDYTEKLFYIDEDLPWHLGNQQNETTLPASLFETLFNKVFALCINSGVVSGHRQAVDSAPIKAIASMEIVVLKIPALP